MVDETDDEEVLDMILSRITSDPTHPRHKQIMAKLEDQPRLAVAQFAAFSAQTENLHLPPWQTPPCYIDDPEAIIARGQLSNENYNSALLLRRMLDRGISRYHPDPLAVL